MRPIDVVRANGLNLTSLGTDRVAAYGFVEDVGLVDIDMTANTALALGMIMRIWPAPGGLATGDDHLGGREYVEGMRFAIVGEGGKLITKMNVTLPSGGLHPIYCVRGDHPRDEEGGRCD